jgi:CelD/BcsL family acetyltransferase involved in cellulose biosynthesis
MPTSRDSGCVKFSKVFRQEAEVVNQRRLAVARGLLAKDRRASEEEIRPLIEEGREAPLVKIAEGTDMTARAGSDFYWFKSFAESLPKLRGTLVAASAAVGVVVGKPTSIVRAAVGDISWAGSMLNLASAVVPLLIWGLYLYVSYWVIHSEMATNVADAPFLDVVCSMASSSRHTGTVHCNPGTSSGLQSHRLKAITASSFIDLAPHLSAWDYLANQAPQRVPNLLPGWIDAFLHHKLKPDERWLCTFAYTDDRLVGVLPIIVTPHPVLGLRHPVLHTPSDAHTPSGDLLLAPDYALPAFQTLLAEIGRQVPSHLGLDLKAARCASPVWAALQDPPEGYLTQRGLRSMYSFLDVRGDLDTYLASLGKIRENVRRGRRKLERRGAVLVELRKGAAADENFLPEFLALEASGWKGRNGTAMVNDPNTVAFYTTLIRNLAAQGYWEWHIIRVNGRPVVAGMGARCGRALMLPKYAFDEDFADCMPGSLLIGEIIRDSFSRTEIDEINPMSSLDAGRFWRMSEDEYVDVHLVRRGVPGQLFQLPRVAMRSVYQDYVRPRIPATLKQAFRRFKRRGDRKPRRAAESQSRQLETNRH